MGRGGSVVHIVLGKANFQCWETSYQLSSVRGKADLTVFPSVPPNCQRCRISIRRLSARLLAPSGSLETGILSRSIGIPASGNRPIGIYGVFISECQPNRIETERAVA